MKEHTYLGQVCGYDGYRLVAFQIFFSPVREIREKESPFSHLSWKKKQNFSCQERRKRAGTDCALRSAVAGTVVLPLNLAAKPFPATGRAYS